MSGWVKGLVIVLALAAGAAAYLHLVDPRLGRELLGDTPIAPPPVVTTAYKWRDARGGWQITDRPPPEGTPYETLEARSDANVMPSLRPGKN